ncbi:hypothetical protein ASPACDRAFT_48132 [Aspergillus aculeatus ATCC 16872]|uniref:Uncharacterized protein n=1 Tax=Aspergillus aculeatus (strain ATCC 16872 / CBS 172.66 / WB 5094) TaxID=690307 RepID=A0A1L9WFU0_ASPA1|nr:uncharacterized protein ASPACDRAFT_48132 [Aspergillus aculeatus ATCC 16872]OJJ95028.1 hypothetical protein ASPACDRAFT_48132 [Aspergillus aculeatus ATCC 16872]
MSATDRCIIIITTIATVLTRSLPLSPSSIIALEHADTTDIPIYPHVARRRAIRPTMQPPRSSRDHPTSHRCKHTHFARSNLLPSGYLPVANRVKRVPRRNGTSIASRGNSTVGQTSKGVWITTGKGMSSTQGDDPLQYEENPSVHRVMVVHGVRQGTTRRLADITPPSCSGCGLGRPWRD